MSKFEGRPCAKHDGATLRYLRDGKCVQCSAELGARLHAAKMAKQGNRKVGVPQGFVPFGTVSHHILRHIHVAGPSSNAELQELLGTVVSTDLRRLVKHGFLFRVGRSRHKPHLRSGALFGLAPQSNLYEPVLTPAQRQARYRSARKLRVASVFDWRGPVAMGCK